MAEYNSPNIYIYIYIYPNLNDQQQFRWNKIKEVRDYFISEIRQRELMSKRLSKYVFSDFFFLNL